MSDTSCEGCGNDEGIYAWCLDCLGPRAEELAPALAFVLGGPVEEWQDVARSIADYVNGICTAADAPVPVVGEA